MSSQVNIQSLSNGYSLQDCVESHKESPKTFEVPAKSEIKKLKVGDFVKLIFVSSIKPGEKIRGERMWVEIISIHNDVFSGRLDNDPVLVTQLKHNAIIDFESCHIAGIMDNNWAMDDSQKKPRYFALVDKEKLEKRVFESEREAISAARYSPNAILTEFSSLADAVKFVNGKPKQKKRRSKPKPSHL